jgi:acyl-coenzyme A thioesterase PaaI-like protein
MNQIKAQTHEKINPALCGTPVRLETGHSRIALTTSEEMVVDDTGLVHGGFVFGLADYSAMLAVNHPNVVLGSADVRFMKPVKSGQQLVSEADTVGVKGRKHTVQVVVSCGSEAVFSGTFVCFVLERHVLAD